MEDEKFYVLFYDPSMDSSLLRERVAMLGDRFMLDKTTFIVKTKYSAAEICEIMVQPPAGQMNLFVAQLHPEEGNIYGLYPVHFWKFMGLYQENKEEKENDNDSKGHEH